MFDRNKHPFGRSWEDWVEGGINGCFQSIKTRILGFGIHCSVGQTGLTTEDELRERVESDEYGNS